MGECPSSPQPTPRRVYHFCHRPATRSRELFVGSLLATENSNSDNDHGHADDVTNVTDVTNLLKYECFVLST